MIYRVVMDGNDILNFQERQFVLINPMLDMELNTAGSFNFTMPPAHEFYDSIRPIKSTIEVYEDEDMIWFGRPIEMKVDYFKQRQVYCEGALAFFNDSIQRPHEYDSISVHTFFRTVVAAHNTQVSADRQFNVGRITVPNINVYRKLTYESTFDVIKRQCLNAEGGYLFARRVNGVNYIDWLKDMPYSCNQPVEFGLNLLDMTSDFDGSTITTCVVPLGDEVEETGQRLTVASFNGGSDTIESAAVSTYGRITKVVEFPGVKYAETLYADGIEYLQSAQFDDLIIECTAAELHSQNENYEQFRVGQMIRCRSNPHLLDRSFPLVRMSLSLDTAAKQITLGTAARMSLTKITKEVEEAAVEDPATQEEISEISADIEDINTDIADINTDIGNIKDDITDIQNRIDGGGDGWTHQINGQSVQTATINFVT